MNNAELIKALRTLHRSHTLTFKQRHACATLIGKLLAEGDKAHDY